MPEPVVFILLFIAVFIVLRATFRSALDAWLKKKNLFVVYAAKKEPDEARMPEAMAKVGGRFIVFTHAPAIYERRREVADLLNLGHIPLLRRWLFRLGMKVLGAKRVRPVERFVIGSGILLDRNRIVVITHEFWPFPGGIAVYVRETAEAMARAGMKVSVWCPAHPELDGATFPFAVRQMPLKGTQGWTCRWKLAALMRRERRLLGTSVVLLPEPGAVLTAMYSGLLRLPEFGALTVLFHGSEIINLSRGFRLRRLFVRLLAGAERIGVVSRFCANLPAIRSGLDASKIRIVNGALRTDYAPVVREKQGDAGGRVVVLCVGRIHPRKGQLALVSAAALLPENVKSRVTVRLVGRAVRPEYLSEIRAAAERGGVTLDIAGEIPDAALPDAYAACDIFAMPSVPQENSVEGFGLVYLEAGACGVPVVAHDTGGVADAVRDGVTGLLVPPDDRRALADALLKLIESPELRRRMGEAGRAHSREFSWDRNVVRLFGDGGEVS